MPTSRNGYRNFLLALLALFPTYPLLVSLGPVGQLVELTIGLIVFATGIRATQGGTHQTLKTIIPCLLVLFLWLLEQAFASISWIRIFRAIAFMLFYLLMIWSVSGNVFQSRAISRTEQLYGAICLYLIIGVLFSHIYLFVHILNPDAFGCTSAMCQPNFDLKFRTGVHVYFSFVTLTSVGYGDVIPLNSFAGMIATLEAIIGQMYSAIVIARLVGLHILDAVTPKE
jgi:hypothetical protein